jgi:hypothetical protein
MENRETRPRGILRSLPKQVLAVILIAALAGIYPMATHTSWEINVALITGALMSTVNALLGYAAIEYSIGRSYTTFLKIVMGGMGIRLMVMLGVLLLCIKALSFPVIPFVASLMTFYVIFLALEVLYIQFRFRKINP